MRFRFQNGNEQPCLLIKRPLTIYQMRFVIRSAEFGATVAEMDYSHLPDEYEQLAQI